MPLKPYQNSIPLPIEKNENEACTALFLALPFMSGTCMTRLNSQPDLDTNNLDIPASILSQLESKSIECGPLP